MRRKVPSNVPLAGEQKRHELHPSCFSHHKISLNAFPRCSRALRTQVCAHPPCRTMRACTARGDLSEPPRFMYQSGATRRRRHAVERSAQSENGQTSNKGSIQCDRSVDEDALLLHQLHGGRSNCRFTMCNIRVRGLQPIA
jgi:hypothetical protein